MKTIVVLSVLVSIAMAFSTSHHEDAQSRVAAQRSLPALQHEEEHDELGQFTLRYVTAEGTVVSERGRLVPASEGKDKVLITEGEVSYIGDDGKTYVTKYTAGVDGYNAKGDHFPQAPEPEPVPTA